MPSTPPPFLWYHRWPSYDNFGISYLINWSKGYDKRPNLDPQWRFIPTMLDLPKSVGHQIAQHLLHFSRTHVSIIIIRPRCLQAVLSGLRAHADWTCLAPILLRLEQSIFARNVAASQDNADKVLRSWCSPGLLSLCALLLSFREAKREFESRHPQNNQRG